MWFMWFWKRVRWSEKHSVRSFLPYRDFQSRSAVPSHCHLRDSSISHTHIHTLSLGPSLLTQLHSVSVLLVHLHTPTRAAEELLAAPHKAWHWPAVSFYQLPAICGRVKNLCVKKEGRMQKRSSPSLLRLHCFPQRILWLLSLHRWASLDTGQHPLLQQNIQFPRSLSDSDSLLFCIMLLRIKMRF